MAHADGDGGVAFAFAFAFEFDGFLFFLLLLSSSSLASAVTTLSQTIAVASTVLLGENPRRIVRIAVRLVGSSGSGSAAGSDRRTDTQGYGRLGRRKRCVDKEIVVDLWDVAEIEWWEVALIWRVDVTLSFGYDPWVGRRRGGKGLAPVISSSSSHLHVVDWGDEIGHFGLFGAGLTRILVVAVGGEVVQVDEFEHALIRYGERLVQIVEVKILTEVDWRTVQM